MTKTRRIAMRASAVTLVGLFAASAHALQVLSFDQPQFSGDGVTIGVGSALSVDGFSLSALGRAGLDFFSAENLANKVNNGTPQLYAINDVTLSLSRLDGRTFSLASLDFGGSYLAAADRIRWAEGIEVSGHRRDGSVVTSILGLDRTVRSPGYTSAQFGAAFSNLDSVSFHGLGDMGFGRNNHEFVLDNLSVTAVPEPETWMMLAGGLGLLALWRRRV